MVPRRHLYLCEWLFHALLMLTILIPPVITITLFLKVRYYFNQKKGLPYWIIMLRGLPKNHRAMPKEINFGKKFMIPAVTPCHRIKGSLPVTVLWEPAKQPPLWHIYLMWQGL